MNIDKKQLKGKIKQIGHKAGNPVMEAETKGGLHIIVAVKKNGDMETIALAPHKAIARHMAQKDHPDLKMTQLEKSETLTKSEIEAGLPEAYQMLKIAKMVP